MKLAKVKQDNAFSQMQCLCKFELSLKGQKQPSKVTQQHLREYELRGFHFVSLSVTDLLVSSNFDQQLRQNLESFEHGEKYKLASLLHVPQDQKLQMEVFLDFILVGTYFNVVKTTLCIKLSTLSESLSEIPLSRLVMKLK